MKSVPRKSPRPNESAAERAPRADEIVQERAECEPCTEPRPFDRNLHYAVMLPKACGNIANVIAVATVYGRYHRTTDATHDRYDWDCCGAEVAVGTGSYRLCRSQSTN